MSLEAIAAMLGHKSLDMTLVYAKIANRTVAEEYFTVAEKVDALYARPAQLPGDASARTWPASTANTTASSATATASAPSHGLRVREHLRDLHVLHHRPRVPTHPARPTRRRLRQRPKPAEHPSTDTLIASLDTTEAS